MFHYASIAFKIIIIVGITGRHRRPEKDFDLTNSVTLKMLFNGF